MEISEITSDLEPAHVPGRPPPPAILPITDISVWVERYSLMVATIAVRFPEKALELFAYQAMYSSSKILTLLEGRLLD